MHTRLILSIDRRHSIETAESILDLATRLHSNNGAGVVGLDLCGDPTARPAGEIAMFTPVFEKASKAGLGITVHFAEAEASGSHDELRTLLSWKPGRLGHVIWEDEAAKKEIAARELCLELCLSCNVQAEMIHGGFEAHHFKHWMGVKGPKISLAVSQNLLCDGQLGLLIKTANRRTTLGYLVAPFQTSIDWWRSISILTALRYVLWLDRESRVYSVVSTKNSDCAQLCGRGNSASEPRSLDIPKFH